MESTRKSMRVLTLLQKYTLKKKRICRFLSIPVLFSLLLAPCTTHAFSFEAEEKNNQTHLYLNLDSPGQISSAQRKKTELILALQEPCGRIEHLWHAKDETALLQAILLEYDHIRIKFSSAVSRFWLRRTSDKTLCVSVEGHKSEYKKESVQQSSVYTDPVASRFLGVSAQEKTQAQGMQEFSLGVEIFDEKAYDLRKSLRGVEKLPYSQMQELLKEKTPEDDLGSFWKIFNAVSRFFVSDAFAQERALSIAPQDIRARVNLQGPEAWPEQDGLETKTETETKTGIATEPTKPKGNRITTFSEVQAADTSLQQNTFTKEEKTPRSIEPPKVQEIPKVQEAPKEKKEPAHPLDTFVPTKNSESSVREKATKKQEGVVAEQKEEEEKKEEKPREVIYVDESGNPVEKPLDVAALWKEVEELLEQKKYTDTLIILDRLLGSGELNQEDHEKALYTVSDCYWFLYEKDPLAGYDDIVTKTLQALNFNLRSKRAPDALLRLALANLHVGNIDEGEGYIMAIMRRYPNYPGVAIGIKELGKIFEKRKNYPQAEKYYSIVLDKYPESSQLKEASVGLISVLFKENKLDRARLILDFVNKRWPRQYIDDPNFLLTEASIERSFALSDRQVQTMWLLYNLQPKTEHTVPMFLEMADLYLQANNPTAASFLYKEVINRAPESDEAITAKLRLLEKGFYNSPINENSMFALFGRGAQPPFWQMYQEVSNQSKTQPDAVLARLKYALWLLWDKQYPEAMEKASNFIDEYPDHPDKKVAEDIIWEAFQRELSLAFTEQNYIRIVKLWNAFSLVRKRYGAPDPRLRYALAMGKKALGDEAGAFQLFQTFLNSTMDPQYGEQAFLEVFNFYLAHSNWNEILDLGKTVAGWNLRPELRQDLTYAMALSAQNLNLPGTALSLWQRIADNPRAQTYQKAWATVFLAQDAERRKDIRQSYAQNLKIIDYFTQLQEERSDKADPERIKSAMITLMDICEVANRIPEALQWINRYHAFAPNDTKEYPALRYRESRLYRKLGDNNRAQALLEEIIKNFPDSPYAQASKTELETFEISRDLQNFQSSDGQNSQIPK